MHYDGSIYDLPHAGLLTLIVLVWAAWFAIGWYVGASRGPVLCGVLGCVLVGASIYSVFLGLVVVLWVAFFVVGATARRKTDARK